MKRILAFILMTILLVGCSKDNFNYYMDGYIEEQGITNIEEIMVYEDKPNIKLVIFKGTLDGTKENLYYCEGLPGSGKGEGIFSNGSYTSTLLALEEGMTYNVHNGEDYGYDKSYFMGIAYRKMTDVYWKGESIDFKSVKVSLNNKEITLTVWIMPFSNGEDISISDFEYKK